MSYSIVVKYSDRADGPSTHVALSKPKLEELRSKIPFYEELTITHKVILRCPNGSEIDSNTKLQQALRTHQGPLVIHINTNAKEKRKQMRRRKKISSSNPVAQSTDAHSNDKQLQQQCLSSSDLNVLKNDTRNVPKSQIASTTTRCDVCGAEFRFQMNDHNWNEHLRGKRHKMAAQNLINEQEASKSQNSDCSPKQLVTQITSEPSKANEDEKRSVNQCSARLSSESQQGTQCDEDESTASSSSETPDANEDQKCSTDHSDETADASEKLRAFRCDICGVQMLCQKSWNQHIRGEKHKNAVQIAASAVTAGNVENEPAEVENGGTIDCNACNVSTPLRSWEQYLRGKRNTTNIASQIHISQQEDERGIQSISEVMPTKDHPECHHEDQQSEIAQWFPTRLLNKNHKKKIGTLEFPTELKAYSQRETVPTTLNFPMNFSIGRHVCPLSLRKGCFLKFRASRNLSADDHEFKVTEVGIPYLPYRWQLFDDTKNEWYSLSRAESVDLEQQYNPKHAAISDALQTENGDQIQRITRFTGTVLRVDRWRARGLVQINYPEEYGEGTGIQFNFKDFQFDWYWDSLSIGHCVEYNIRGDLAVNVTPYFEEYKVDIQEQSVFQCIVCNVEFNTKESLKCHRKSREHSQAARHPINNIRLNISRQCVLQNLPDSKNYKPRTVFAWSCVSKLHHIDQSTNRGALEVPSKLRPYLPSTEYITFKVNPSLFNVKEGCTLWYDAQWNAESYLGQARQSEICAKRVRIPYLTFRWQRYDARSDEWRSLSSEESVDLENRYNAKDGDIEGAIVTKDGERFRRITRFKGKVLKLHHNGKVNKVQINYPDEYGDQVGVDCSVKDCQFRADQFRVGDYLEYGIRVSRAIDVSVPIEDEHKSGGLNKSDLPNHASQRTHEQKESEKLRHLPDHTFSETYASRVISIDKAKRVGKLKFPMALERFHSKQRKWFQESEGSHGVRCDDELSSRLDVITIGDEVKYAAPAPGGYSMSVTTITVRKISDQTAREIVDPLSTLTCPLRFERRWPTSSEDAECLTFHFDDYHDDNEMLKSGCLLMYNVCSSGKDQVRAINVRSALIPYRWSRFEQSKNEWMTLSRAESVHMESRYNPEHCQIEEPFRTENGVKIDRFTRFKGQIYSIDSKANRGQILLNYWEEDEVEDNTFWFDIASCPFNAKWLQPGDVVALSIEGKSAVDLEFWIIPYR